MKISTNSESPATTNNASWKTALISTPIYTYSVLSLVSWWFFLVPNKHLPDAVANLKLYSMDTAPTVQSMWLAAAINVAAMFTFGFTHSLFARKSVKKWMGLPKSIERSFFCLQGAFFLHMVQKYWVDVDSVTVWELSSQPWMTTIILTVFWLGSAILLSATFALDHFHLFGLSQGFGMDLNGMVGLAPVKSEAGLATRWHYRFVAHPIMTGALINFWATPIMTPARLVLALFMTGYVFAAVIRLEEPSIREDLGQAYDSYLKRTPRFFPSAPYKLKISIEKNDGAKKDD